MIEIIEFIKKKGIDLSKNFHVNNFAFKINDSLELLRLMKNEDILVYGGDVLKYEGKKYVYTYDNWSYDGEDSLISINKSIEKVIFFSEEINDEIFITLVCSFDFYKIIKE